MAEENFRETPVQAADVHQYRLPFPNAEVDALLLMANNAQSQAIVTGTACRQAMTENENTTTGVIPAFPQIQDAFASGIVYSTKSLLLSAEAAYQAQTSVCEALNAALAASTRQKGALGKRLDEVNREIDLLNLQANQLRGSFAKAADKPDKDKAYATTEAKRLLQCLEAAYEKHELCRRIQKQISDTNANIVYLSQESDQANQYKNEIEALLHRAEEEWRRIATLFNMDGAAAKGDFLRSTLLHGAAEASTAKEKTEKAPPPEATAEDGQEQRPSAWAMIWSYIKVVLLAFLIAVALRAYVLDVTRVDGTSMYPTLHDGDTLITSKLAYVLDNTPRRGDIVVLDAPDSPGEKYIKRVVGLPNEEVLVQAGKVYINGELLDEPYLTELETSGNAHLIVPDGYYFVMGDNRDESRDSRAEDVGPISIDSIEGQAVLRIFPFSGFGSL